MGTVIGRNRGSYGLFVANPGINPATAGGYTSDDDRLKFSSDWDRIAGYYQVGTTRKNTTVGWVGLGYKPLVRFEEIDGSVLDGHPIFSKFASTGASNGTQDFFDWSRWELTYPSDNSFRILVRDTFNDNVAPNPIFRYAILNLSVES